jgi:hypothetical protein
VNIIGTNWISNGWGNGAPNGSSVMVNRTGTVLMGTDPMLDPTTHRPLAGSPAIGAATGTTPHDVMYEFLDPLGVKARASATDLGAYAH